MPYLIKELDRSEELYSQQFINCWWSNPGPIQKLGLISIPIIFELSINVGIIWGSLKLFLSPDFLQQWVKCIYHKPFLRKQLNATAYIFEGGSENTSNAICFLFFVNKKQQEPAQRIFIFFYVQGNLWSHAIFWMTDQFINTFTYWH